MNDFTQSLKCIHERKLISVDVINQKTNLSHTAFPKGIRKKTCCAVEIRLAGLSLVTTFLYRPFIARYFYHQESYPDISSGYFL